MNHTVWKIRHTNGRTVLEVWDFYQYQGMHLIERWWNPDWKEVASYAHTLE